MSLVVCISCFPSVYISVTNCRSGLSWFSACLIEVVDIMYAAYIWKNTPMTSHWYWWLTSRKWFVMNWKTANSLWNLNRSPSCWKYKIGAAVQILETIRFILFRDDSFTRGQSNMRWFIYERSASNIRDWSLAYSFESVSSWYIFFSGCQPICLQ